MERWEWESWGCFYVGLRAREVSRGSCGRGGNGKHEIKDYELGMKSRDGTLVVLVPHVPRDIAAYTRHE